MASKITFFPVGNGDMTLIKLEDSNETTILIDVNIRNSADDDEDPVCDVAKELRERLKKDSEERPYVDVFLLSHPDQDHCNGLSKHFHLGPLDDYDFNPSEGEDLKIVIREMWSSPMVFRRASKNNTLCEDAKAFNTEAKRRVNVFKDSSDALAEGDRIIIIGEDEDGKTDGLEEILVKIDTSFNKVNGKDNNCINMHVLGPLPKQELEEDESRLEKNHSSVIIQFSIAPFEFYSHSCLYLTGGDAAVAIWDTLWKKHQDNPEHLQYDLLLSPHHCSWHVLSYESWDGGKNNPKADQNAKSALSQANGGAFIVSSSDPIKNNDSDPPCVGAKKEYVSIVGIEGFHCTGEYPSEKKTEPLEFKITEDGPQPPAIKKGPYVAGAGLSMAKEPFNHG